MASRRRVPRLAACRKLEPHGYTLAEGWEDIRALRKNWIPLPPDWPVFERAEQLTGRYSLSFWDSMVVAACLEGGVARLYTEDFGAYPNTDGLEIVNPFRP